MKDAISPGHYARLEPEPIDVIEGWGLGFCLGNAVKYIARAGHKPGADRREDLAKAIWYLQRELGAAERAAPGPVFATELGKLRRIGRRASRLGRAITLVDVPPRASHGHRLFASPYADAAHIRSGVSAIDRIDFDAGAIWMTETSQNNIVAFADQDFLFTECP